MAPPPKGGIASDKRLRSKMRRLRIIPYSGTAPQPTTAIYTRAARIYICMRSAMYNQQLEHRQHCPENPRSVLCPRVQRRPRLAGTLLRAVC